MNAKEKPPTIWDYGCGLLFFSVVLAAGCYRGISSYVAGLDTESAVGIVVRLDSHVSADSTFYTPVVEFVVTEKTFQFKRAEASSPGHYHVGDQVAVRYRADDPAESALIDSFYERWLSACFFIFGGLLPVFYAIGARIRARFRGTTTHV